MSFPGAFAVESSASSDLVPKEGSSILANALHSIAVKPAVLFQLDLSFRRSEIGISAVVARLFVCPIQTYLWRWVQR